jgi:hypothetical protein
MTLEQAKQKLPKNVKSRKRLNCAVFEFTYAALEDEGQSIDTCRAVFLPTKSSNEKDPGGKILWTGCGLNPLAHVQICVRSANCILGTWLVKPSEV